MPNGAAALPSPLERQRRWATELRKSRRLLPTVPAPITSEEEPFDSAQGREQGPVFGEEGFGEVPAPGVPGAAAAEGERPRAREAEGAPTAALAQGQQIQAARRELETQQLEARRKTTESKAAEKAKAEASKRARTELTKFLLQGAKAGTGVTVVGLLIAFAIMNLQLVAINIYNRGKPMFQIPPLAMWEVVLVLVLDFLCIVLNPFTLFIIFFVTLFGGGLSI